MKNKIVFLVVFFVLIGTKSTCAHMCADWYNKHVENLSYSEKRWVGTYLYYRVVQNVAYVAYCIAQADSVFGIANSASYASYVAHASAHDSAHISTYAYEQAAKVDAVVDYAAHFSACNGTMLDTAVNYAAVYLQHYNELYPDIQQLTIISGPDRGRQFPRFDILKDIIAYDCNTKCLQVFIVTNLARSVCA